MTDELARLPLIGEKAPAFKAETMQGPLNFPDDFKGKWVLVRAASPRNGWRNRAPM